MRILSHASLWTLCVCVLVNVSPLSPTVSAHAQAGPAKKKVRVVKRAKKAKSVRRCMKFSQRLGTDEESVDLKLENNCKIEVACSIEWKLTCSEDDGPRTSIPSKQSTVMEFADDWSVNASAASCDMDWEVGEVSWNCEASV